MNKPDMRLLGRMSKHASAAFSAPHHCEVQNTKVMTKILDLAGIKGKKMQLPGEVLE